jgi:signal transduction histidine kinase
MRKIGIIFVLAVLAPSLVLAWLAIRSLQDQQFVLERQQAALQQGAADALAERLRGTMAELQREFEAQVEGLLADQSPRTQAENFDALLRGHWPLAEVGFSVTLDGTVLSPSLASDQRAQQFRQENASFLAENKAEEVYPALQQAAPLLRQKSFSKNTDSFLNQGRSMADSSLAPTEPPPTLEFEAKSKEPSSRTSSTLQSVYRKVQPLKAAPQPLTSLVRVQAALTQFRELATQAMSGALGRYVDEELRLYFWYRSPRDPQLVFGVELNRTQLLETFRPILAERPRGQEEICLALLDDRARPVLRSQASFETNWRRPFVASEIGEVLPYWEATVYLLNPSQLSSAARSLQFTIGLLVLVLVVAIVVGGWLTLADLQRELRLARQKTDFVSNVSHELKTPLTSIRLFSELLADGTETPPDKVKHFAHIIANESARLTRLINNVLDFAQMERGTKRYDHQTFDWVSLTREVIENFRPPAEANGYQFDVHLPVEPISIRGDADALSQVLLNLLSNGEKYGGTAKQITVQMVSDAATVRVKVSDRGLGIPRRLEQKIFDKFYRVNDALNSGIQGAGLGLALARQMARAHGGDVTYAARIGGGSVFTLILPRENLS